jgi:hypothetical protein
MKLSCPHCSQTLELTPEVHAQLQGQPHFDCPECGGAIAVPPMTPQRPSRPEPKAPQAAASTANAVAKTQLGLSRNMRWLGLAALLVLGAVGVFVALRGGNTINTTQNIQQFINNQFFQNLLTSGKATRQALEEMLAIHADESNYVGVSRDKLTWAQAQDLARRAGAQVLALEPEGHDLRQPRLERLAKLFPELHGLTTWVSDADLPALVDSPDLAHASTPERPRQALFQWFSLPEDKRHWMKVVSTNPPSPHLFKTNEFVRAKVEFNNPGPEEVSITVQGLNKGKTVSNVYQASKGSYPVGKGSDEAGFSVRQNSEVDVIQFTMREAVSRKTLVVASLPVKMEWKRDMSDYDLELIAVKAPATLSAKKEIRIPAKAGQKFKVDLTARYKTPSTTKLASHLYLEEAKILPPEIIAELNKNYATTIHFDTGSRPGYKAVVGPGEISYELTGYAPKEPGTYTFKMMLGLFDYQNWSTILKNEHTVTLEVTP